MEVQGRYWRARPDTRGHVFPAEWHFALCLECPPVPAGARADVPVSYPRLVVRSQNTQPTLNAPCSAADEQPVVADVEDGDGGESAAGVAGRSLRIVPTGSACGGQGSEVPRGVNSSQVPELRIGPRTNLHPPTEKRGNMYLQWPHRTAGVGAGR